MEIITNNLKISIILITIKPIKLMLLEDDTVISLKTPSLGHNFLRNRQSRFRENDFNIQGVAYHREKLCTEDRAIYDGPEHIFFFFFNNSLIVFEL